MKLLAILSITLLSIFSMNTHADMGIADDIESATYSEVDNNTSKSSATMTAKLDEFEQVDLNQMPATASNGFLESTTLSCAWSFD